MKDVLFLAFTFFITASAMAVVLARNPIYSVLNMVVCFMGVGGLYLVWGAPFLAIVHLIVYAGAIMVLFLFVILMMNLNEVPPSPWSKWAPLVSIGSGALSTVGVAWVSHTWPTQYAVSLVSTKALGWRLFQSYAGPFELSAILFLAAVIGVVTMTRSSEKEGSS